MQSRTFLMLSLSWLRVESAVSSVVLVVLPKIIAQAFFSAPSQYSCFGFLSSCYEKLVRQILMLFGFLVSIQKGAVLVCSTKGFKSYQNPKLLCCSSSFLMCVG